MRGHEREVGELRLFRKGEDIVPRMSELEGGVGF